MSKELQAWEPLIIQAWTWDIQACSFTFSLSRSRSQSLSSSSISLKPKSFDFTMILWKPESSRKAEHRACLLIILGYVSLWTEHRKVPYKRPPPLSIWKFDFLGKEVIMVKQSSTTAHTSLIIRWGACMEDFSTNSHLHRSYVIKWNFEHAPLGLPVRMLPFGLKVQNKTANFVTMSPKDHKWTVLHSKHSHNVHISFLLPPTDTMKFCFSKIEGCLHDNQNKEKEENNYKLSATMPSAATISCNALQNILYTRGRPLIIACECTFQGNPLNLSPPQQRVASIEKLQSIDFPFFNIGSNCPRLTFFLLFIVIFHVQSKLL